MAGLWETFSCFSGVSADLHSSPAKNQTTMATGENPVPVDLLLSVPPEGTISDLLNVSTLTFSPVSFIKDTFMLSQQFFAQSTLADRYKPQKHMCRSITKDINY